MQWRRWNNVLHRDLGYLCVGLTLVYVVSGVAVNHIHQWNPTYQVDRRTTTITPRGTDELGASDAIARMLDELGLAPTYRTIFRPDSATVRVFVQDGTVDVELATGRATVEIVRERRVLGAANFLHLNHAKQLWTWMADVYALALGLLAVTGLFVLKGKKGIEGRGAWLTALGVAIPVVFLVLYR